MQDSPAAQQTPTQAGPSQKQKPAMQTWFSPAQGACAQTPPQPSGSPQTLFPQSGAQQEPW